MENLLRVGQQVILFADSTHDVCGQQLESRQQATYLGRFHDVGSGRMFDVYEFQTPIICPFCGGEIQHFCSPAKASFHLTNLDQVKGLKTSL